MNLTDFIQKGGVGTCLAYLVIAVPTYWFHLIEPPDDLVVTLTLISLAGVFTPGIHRASKNKPAVGSTAGDGAPPESVA